VKRIEGPTNPLGGAIDYANLSSMPEAQRRAAVLAMAPYIGKDDRSARLTVVLADEPFSREALDTIVRLIDEIPRIRASVPELRSAQVYVGGVTAVLNDVRDNMGRDLQVMAVVVITGLFIVLLLVLGSVLIPVRAILTILLSIAWTMGLTIVLFHLWKGIDVIFILPLALFVMAMGLGMDYDIFIITRVREEVAKGKSDPEAITEAMTRTGGIISACGIVMAGAFLTLMLNPSPLLQQIGFALAFAILVDSMVVRIYLVPAIMVLAGKYNWWAPGRLQRVRREAKNSRLKAGEKP
jgi:RND superfamily putative drug exporter